MRKKLIITVTITCSLLILLSINGIANALVGFMLAGVIPGTTIIVPFWAMVTLWCLIITAITTAYLETTIGFLRSRKQHDQRRARMPRRRYSNI